MNELRGQTYDVAVLDEGLGHRVWSNTAEQSRLNESRLWALFSFVYAPWKGSLVVVYLAADPAVAAHHVTRRKAPNARFDSMAIADVMAIFSQRATRSKRIADLIAKIVGAQVVTGENGKASILREDVVLRVSSLARRHHLAPSAR